MNRIYNFEQHDPPILNENMIRREIERRRLRLQTGLLLLAGILLQIVVGLLGYSAIDWYPKVSLFCFSYIVISTMGCVIVAVAYHRKGDLVQ